MLAHPGLHEGDRSEECPRGSDEEVQARASSTQQDVDPPSVNERAEHERLPQQHTPLGVPCHSTQPLATQNH